MKKILTIIGNRPRFIKTNLVFKTINETNGLNHGNMNIRNQTEWIELIGVDKDGFLDTTARNLQPHSDGEAIKNITSVLAGI